MTDIRRGEYVPAATRAAKRQSGDPVTGAEMIKLPISALIPQKVREAYDRQTPATGAAMLRSLQAIWNTWAAETEADAANPVPKVTRKRGRVAKVKPRTGALAPSDRAPWYMAAEQIARTSPSSNTARALQFLFLTGLRRDEVLAMPWSEVDLDAGTITIARGRMKAGEELVRPITPEMRRILDSQLK